MNSDRPRLCIVTPVHASAFMGGAEYQIHCLLQYLRVLDRYDIHFLARVVPAQDHLDGYTIHRIGDGGPMPRFGYAVDALDLYRCLRRLKPDVIYQRVASAYTGVAAYYAKRHGARMIWHAASDADFNRKIQVAQRNFVRTYLESSLLAYGIRRADHIVVQTRHQARLLEDHYARRATAVVANFHPDPEATREPDEPLQILWVANFKPLKRPDAFIQLAEDLRDLTHVQFVMIGASASGGKSAEWHADLDRRMSSLPNLKCLGQLSQDQVNARLAGAYAFVNTSLYEGFPNTFIQAWQRGAPVVSLAVNPDGVLDDESVGIHAGSQHRLADAVRRLVDDRGARDRMSRSAMEHARKFHSMRNAEKLAQLIDGEILEVGSP
jgi:glycosyltransferase involved in cell wall biosynthesis